MTVVGIQGGNDAKRSELARVLLGALKARGQSVSVIAYAGASADIDIPGKDSYEHRRAGASEVLAVSRLRWALVHETPEEDSAAHPDVNALLARLAPVDFVLASGFTEKAAITLDLATGGKSLHAACGGGPDAVFHLDMAGQIADFIVNAPAEKQPST
jgi:molybdopterin-guanine dinucleotide biosynthesis protein B